MSQFEIDTLKESNGFLNAIFDNINSAVFVVDENVKVQKVNDSFEKLFEADELESTGKLCGNAIGCAYTVDENTTCGNTSYCGQCTLRASILKALTSKIPTNKDTMKRELVLGDRRIDKEFQYSTKHIRFDGETIIVVIVDDLTEINKQKHLLAKQNEELAELNKQKNEFLGMAAHDLRNPIGGIIQFSELLLDPDFEMEAEERTEILRLIKNSSEFSLALLSDLLNINRIESGKVDLNLEEVDYQSFISSVIAKNMVFAKNKNIELTTDLPNEKIILCIDKNKIEQVLNNFISNAIKFSYPNTKITLKIKATNGQIETTCIDQGQGIPANELSRVFKPFEKTSVQTTANESSTGLGLAITKKIIESHQGEVGVRSEVRKGSEFYFTLPK